MTDFEYEPKLKMIFQIKRSAWKKDTNYSAKEGDMVEVFENIAEIEMIVDDELSNKIFKSINTILAEG